MAPRKRQTGKRGEDGETVVKAAKAKANRSAISSQSTSPTVVFVVIVTMVAITSGIYCYYFVDVTELFDKLQTQVNILSGKEEIPLSQEADYQQQSDQKEQAPDLKNGVKQEEKQNGRQDKSENKKDESRQKRNEQKAESKSSTNKEKETGSTTRITVDGKAAENSVDVQLTKANLLLGLRESKKALDMFDELLKKHPKNPKILHAKAGALNKLAEQQRSNKLLEESIEMYLQILELPDVPKDLMLTAVTDCVERMQFRGWSAKAIKALRRVLEIYPDELKIWNDLGVQYMMTGKVEAARKVYKYVLESNPNDGFAKVHLGFIIKTTDSDNEASIPYLREGIATGDTGVIDGRFFFHLGDALYRTGKHDQAYDVYRDGVDKGIFRSMWQRSLYNVDTLTARPWWTVKQTKHEAELKTLEKKWKDIRDEGLAQLDPKTGSFLPEEENLREKGEWKQFTLFQQGRKNVENCKKVPKTCALIEAIPDAANCKRGQVKFSVMQPGVHIWPHCGPTNCRIRAHLGLVIPDGPQIRVENDTRTWTEGEFIVFDDSFEHEVWHRGTKTRLVLIVDLWHPDLTSQEKAQLTPI